MLQETFLIAQCKMASFQGNSTEELLAWFCAILLNMIHAAQQKYIGVQARDVRREVLLDFLSSSQNGLPADVDSPSGCAHGGRA